MWDFPLISIQNPIRAHTSEIGYLIAFFVSQYPLPFFFCIMHTLKPCRDNRLENTDTPAHPKPLPRNPPKTGEQEDSRHLDGDGRSGDTAKTNHKSHRGVHTGGPCSP